MKNLLKSFIVFILQSEARLVMLKYKPKIIGVTGSVGKTGAKDAIFAVIENHFFAYKSKKSYNSEIGIPLTILMIDTGWKSPMLWLRNIVRGIFLIILKNHYPKLLVLEIGIDRPGDMKRAIKLARPDISVFTTFPETPAHVEYFKNSKEIHNEKWILAKNTKKGGTIIINGDDNILVEKEKELRDDCRVIRYGLNEGNDIRATNIHIFGNGSPKGITFKIDYEGNNVPIKILGVLGVGYVYSALSAIAVGISEGLNLVEISQAFLSFSPPPGRVRILEGIEGSTLIDDTYNSSPNAAKMAIGILKEVNGARKIAILGDMLELGNFTVSEHKDLGKFVAENAIDLLYTVGPRAQSIAKGANDSGMLKKNIKEFLDSKKAGESLAKIIQKGDVVLIKGSQRMRLERAVEALLLHPEQKQKLLVRQEKEWFDR